MATNIVVPELSESVVEATISEWLKNEGDSVTAGETVVVLETDKVSLEVAAESDGVLSRIDRQAGEDVGPGDVLGVIEGSGSSNGAAKAEPEAVSQQAEAQQEPEPAAAGAKGGNGDVSATPVARRLAQAHDVDISSVSAGDGGKVTKDDVQKFINQKSTPPPAPRRPQTQTPAASTPASPTSNGNRREEVVRMSRRRQTIARRLVEAQQTAAMLTTFNEVDMTGVMALRGRRKEAFKEKHGISLGLSSFFVKATIGALKTFPRLNAEIDVEKRELTLKQYYDIGIAIGAEEGLVVPVLRDADRMSFAEIEGAIRDYAKQVQDGTLAIESLMGGTFTITNGGVFGSMLSTPILNPPQVGILGLHAIKDRPMAVDGQVVIRPIMYVALTYDHRIVDGREAVQFLVKLKELIEDPETLLLEV
jgi:2-oxoglutarate dehydrogenase E2 component (dihydrolipoamide succinyltransferase)